MPDIRVASVLLAVLMGLSGRVGGEHNPQVLQTMQQLDDDFLREQTGHDHADGHHHHGELSPMEVPEASVPEEDVPEQSQGGSDERPLDLKSNGSDS